jgi:hypothetical protein
MGQCHGGCVDGDKLPDGGAEGCAAGPGRLRLGALDEDKKRCDEEGSHEYLSL